MTDSQLLAYAQKVLLSCDGDDFWRVKWVGNEKCLLDQGKLKRNHIVNILHANSRLNLNWRGV